MCKLRPCIGILSRAGICGAVHRYSWVFIVTLAVDNGYTVRMKSVLKVVGVLEEIALFNAFNLKRPVQGDARL